MSALAFGLFGLIIGSFLNVFILRHGARSLGGRSECFSCAATLHWYDLVPVLSWLSLRGRCRYCGSSISAQYPAVEVSTALLFALLGAAPLALELRLVGLPIVALLIAVFVYDLKHTIIPDGWVYAFAALSLLFGWISLPPIEGGALFLATAGPLAAAPIFFLWLISGGRWMGLGDAKLSLGIGWLLGAYYGVIAVFFAFVIGAVVSVCILLPLPRLLSLARARGIARNPVSKSFTMKSEVPFGPFLIASTLFIWFMLLYQVPLPL